MVAMRVDSPSATGDVEPKPMLLVVDDDPDLCLLLHDRLQAYGYGVHSVASGREALDALARDRPCAALLDDRLPDLSGIEVLRLARERGITVPILMMSAVGTHRRKALAGALGAQAWIDKPIRPDELERWLKRWAGLESPV